VITDGIIPSLHIDYKGTRIKQYHKEGRALRTETTISNTRDFYIGKSLRNCPLYGKSAFGQIAVCFRSNKSATTASSPRKPSKR
jgi:hypothetical protein